MAAQARVYAYSAQTSAYQVVSIFSESAWDCFELQKHMILDHPTSNIILNSRYLKTEKDE
jgi:hypothetical protein